MALAGILAGLGWTAWPMLAGEGAATSPAEAAAPAAWFGSPESRRANAAPARAAGIRFGFCHTGGGRNCVVDGDTFWMGGTRIRIADIDTPETHPARCAREAWLGEAATRRLRELLNSGEITLASIGRDADRYGRKLRRVAVDGRGVGDMLAAEGLARRYQGGMRASWCG